MKKYCLIPFLILPGCLYFLPTVPDFADSRIAFGFCLPTQEQVENIKQIIVWEKE